MNMDIVLASQSPRRKELLTQMGLTFTVHPADIQEVIPPGLTPQEAVMALSRQKAAAVAADHPDDLVIAADTIVVFDGRLLGKPHSREEAREMLTALSGKAVTPGGAVELCHILGRDETLRRMAKGIEQLS